MERDTRREPGQHFVIAQGYHTVRDALLMLEERGGQGWWYLIVRVWSVDALVCRFADLGRRVQAEGVELLDRRLDALGEPLEPAAYVDASTSDSAASQLARRSESGLVVLMRPISPDITPSGSLPGIDVARVVDTSRTRGSLSAMSIPPSLFELAHETTAGAEPGSYDESPAIPNMIPSAPAAPAPSQSPRTGDVPRMEPREAEPEETAPGDAGEIVHGDEVHGDKVTTGNITNSTGVAIGPGAQSHVYINSPEPETREQPRRFEAAFPKECHLGVEQKLWVAVMLPDADSPFGERTADHDIAATDEVGVPMPVDGRTGELRAVDVEVTVTATGFRVEGASTKKLTVWPDGRLAKRWFQLEPEVAGEQEIHLEVCIDGRLLQEIDLTTNVYEPQRKARSLLNLSLTIASFGLTFTFAAGAGT